MNFNPTRRAFAAALIAASLSGAAIAQPAATAERPAHGKHFKHMRGDGLPKHLEALGLSDAQKAQMKALHQASFAAKQQTREADRALHESLRALSPSAPNYSAEADRIATLMGQRHAERIRDRAAMRAKQWAILTPSQQSQLAAMPKPEPRKARWHGKQ